MNLYLIRHPKPDVEKGLCYGQTDVPLAANWQVKAQHLKAHLNERTKGESVAYYHSPLTRAAELARALGGYKSRSVNELKELDFGEWENRSWQTISRESVDAWLADLCHATPYNGESLQQLADRVFAWWQSIQTEQVEHRVIVTHSGVIKVLVSLLCQWPLAQSYRIDVDFMSVTEILIQGDYISLKRLGAGDWV